MDEVLTWEEIERRFDGEWVAIADPETTEKLDILGGRVLYHGESQELAFLSLRGIRHGAVEFIGSVSIPGVPLILGAVP